MLKTSPWNRHEPLFCLKHIHIHARVRTHSHVQSIKRWMGKWLNWDTQILSALDQKQHMARGHKIKIYIWTNKLGIKALFLLCVICFLSLSSECKYCTSPCHDMAVQTLHITYQKLDQTLKETVISHFFTSQYYSYESKSLGNSVINWSEVA